MNIRGPRRPHVVPITAPSFPTPPRTNLYRNIAYTFIALTAIVVVAVLWLSSVRAAVTIKTRRTPVEFQGAVEIAKTPSPGQIPGRVLQGVFEKIQEFEVQPPVVASTTAEVVTPEPDAPPKPPQRVIAKGRVRIVNTYSRDQPLVKTTRLLTEDKKLYRIEKNIQVPAHSEVEVDVYADQPGEEYAIGPTRFTIPGLFVDLQTYIYAVSDAPFVGVPEDGPPSSTKTSPAVKRVDPNAKIVTQSDLDRAEELVTKAALDEAKRTLAAEVTDPNLSEVIYITKRVDRLKTNVSLGQPADHFLASIKVDVTAIYYPKEDMSALIRLKLREKIPEGREFLPPDDPTEATTFTLQTSDPKAEVARVEVASKGSYRITPMSPGLQKSVIAGKGIPDAIAILKSIEGVEDAEITIHPRWYRSIPKLKDHIQVEVE